MTLDERYGWLLLNPAMVPAGLNRAVIELSAVQLLPHDVERLLPAREAHFTPEEHAVASLLAQGLSASEIARRLHISRRTAYRRIARVKEIPTTTDAADLGSVLGTTDSVDDDQGGRS